MPRLTITWSASSSLKDLIKGGDAKKHPLVKAVEAAVRSTIEKRTEQLHKEVQQLMSSRSPIIASRRAYRGQSSRSGGTEIPALNTRAAIHPVTGRMRSSLEKKTSVTETGYIGEVGYNRGFAPNNPGKVSTISWPDNPRFTIREINLKPDKEYQQELFPDAESPMEYVPDILLGNKKMVGRNVLRLALIRDIQGQTTLNAMAKAVGRAIRNVKPGRESGEETEAAQPKGEGMSYVEVAGYLRGKGITDFEFTTLLDEGLKKSNFYTAVGSTKRKYKRLSSAEQLKLGSYEKWLEAGIDAWKGIGDYDWAGRIGGRLVKYKGKITK